MPQSGRWHYADETERRKWQNPEQILKQIGLRPGLTLVDLGCGNGFFAMPAARILGASGKVYALDAQKSSVEEVGRRAASEHLANVELITGKAEDTPVCSACADVIFFGIVLHDFDDPAAVLQNAHGMLKPDGKLIDLDWKKMNMHFGPPFSKRFDQPTASKLIEKAGFMVESVQDSGQYFYLITARPGPG